MMKFPPQLCYHLHQRHGLAGKRDHLQHLSLAVHSSCRKINGSDADVQGCAHWRRCLQDTRQPIGAWRQRVFPNG